MQTITPTPTVAVPCAPRDTEPSPAPATARGGAPAHRILVELVILGDARDIVPSVDAALDTGVLQAEIEESLSNAEGEHPTNPILLTQVRRVLQDLPMVRCRSCEARTPADDACCRCGMLP